MSFYLALVSPTDSPLYESHFTSSRPIPPPSASSSSSTSSAFPSWSSFTGVNGVDLGDRESRSRRSLEAASAGIGASGGGGAMSTGANGPPPGPGGDRALLQMIAFKSLDGVEEIMEGTGGLYLRNVDKWNEWTVSAFLANGVKFILLHDHRNDDGIRQFFLEVWELWVKTLLNPFHTVNTPIRSLAFDGKVRTAARRLL